MTTPIVVCAECGARNPAHNNNCGRCEKPLNGPLLPCKPASFDTRVKLVQVVVGMAKEAGYDLDGFVAAVRAGWPHVTG
jgi:hypothetical protein